MPTAHSSRPTVALDADGHLADPLTWTPEVAEELGRASGLERLTAAHWKVLSCCREARAREGRTPSLHRLAQVSGVPVERLRELFPVRTEALIARLAGLPKPRLSPVDPASIRNEENQGVLR